MIFSALKIIFSFLIPSGLIFFAVLTAEKYDFFSDWLPLVAVIFPAAVLIISILLGWRFNRSRLVFAVLVLAIADRALTHFAGDIDYGPIVYNIVSTLLPLNLLFFCFIRERGLFTLSGTWRLVIILFQPITAYLLYKHSPLVFDFLEYSNPFIKITDLSLPQPALMLYFLSAIIFLYASFKKKAPVETGFFWVLLLSFIALQEDKSENLSTVYFATAGLILIIAVLETAYGMAYKDELTKIPSRRALNEHLLRLGKSYSIAMLDIDFFKKFNDTYGHDVGDQVLCMVASKIARVGGGGKSFRYGGEEFTIVFPGREPEEVLPHLERLRKIIEKAGFRLRGSNRPAKKPKDGQKSRTKKRKVSVTISIGVAHRDKKHTKPHTVIKAADKALYRAKKGGRNRISQ